VKLWNADKGLGQLNIDASPNPMLTVEFSPNGKFLAAGGLDKMVRVWELTVKPNA
jgi:WD40 repeat protein